MKSILLTGVVAATALLAACTETATNNANLRGTNTNTGYVTTNANNVTNTTSPATTTTAPPSNSSSNQSGVDKVKPSAPVDSVADDMPPGKSNSKTNSMSNSKPVR